MSYPAAISPEASLVTDMPVTKTRVGFEEIYVAIWCLVMPITGTLLVPSVQGTIPAYMLAFGSVGFALARIRGSMIPPQVQRYFGVLLSITLLWLFLLATSQMTLILTGRHDFRGVFMIDDEDTTVILRSSLFTQSLYFFACVCVALYFRFFFRNEWMKYVYWGGYLLAGYGIYEWLFFVIFHTSGDFLVNRNFGARSASWTQTISFGGMTFVRVKSTLGEPSFFTSVVIPYLCLALDARKLRLAVMLLFAAIFSTSTSCYIALPLTLLIMAFWSGKPRWGVAGIILGFAIFLAGIALLFPDTFQGMFADKFSGKNESGAMRLETRQTLADLYASFSLPNWLFGIGFGYCYAGVYDVLLINTGIIGLGVFLWTFVRPLWLLPTIPGYEGPKAAILSILIVCGLSLSELYLPPMWMFLGLAWFKLAEYRQRQIVESEPSSAPSLNTHSGAVQIP